MGHAVGAAARRLLWGTVVLVIDLRIDGFDVINDVLGILIIVSGLGALVRAVDLEPSRRRFGQAYALAIADTIVITTITLINGTQSTTVLESLDAALGVAGVLLLADGFRLLAAARGAAHLAETWDRTFRLVLFLGAIPLGVVELWALTIVVSEGEPRHYDTPLVVPLLLIAFVPLISLLVSLNRTRTRGTLLDHVPDAAG